MATAKESGNSNQLFTISRRLFEAVKARSLSEVKLLLLTGKLNVNTENDDKENCLVEALRIEDTRKRYAIFSFLLKCGVNIHHRDVSGRDALEWAVKLNCRKEALRLLNGPMIEYDFHHKDSVGLTLLHHATINNMEHVVRAVIKRLQRYYISVDIPDGSGYTPFLYAKELGHGQIIADLAAAGASIHVERRSASRCKSMPLQWRPNFKADRQVVTSMLYRTPSLTTGTNIGSLLQMRSEGKSCDEFVHSSSTTEDDASAPIHSSTTNHTSFTDLQEIFDIASEQMTKSFCRPAEKPKPKTIIFNQSKAGVKASALAAIMKKPIKLLPDRKRPNMKRKASRSDLNSRQHQTPSIAVSLSK